MYFKFKTIIHEHLSRHSSQSQTKLHPSFYATNTLGLLQDLNNWNNKTNNFMRYLYTKPSSKKLEDFLKLHDN